MPRRTIEHLTGGLSVSGAYDVTVVRPRQDGETAEPGRDIRQLGGPDLAVLRALARDDTGERVGVAEPGPTGLRLPALDLSAPIGDDLRSAEPPDLEEQASVR